MNIVVREAVFADLPLIETFLSKPEIDALFTPPLSDPARGISIEERVKRKFENGVWIIAVYEGNVIGTMAIVPAKLTRDVPPPVPGIPNAISLGVSFEDWGAAKIMELSTVVTDQRFLKEVLRAKGVGAKLLTRVIQWTREHGDGTWGLVTDSWVGGDMGGFVAHMNAKACSPSFKKCPDTLVRIYTDPPKRGIHGPATVVYGIPIEQRDWDFFAAKQKEVTTMEGAYKKLEAEKAA